MHSVTGCHRCTRSKTVWGARTRLRRFAATASQALIALVAMGVATASIAQTTPLPQPQPASTQASPQPEAKAASPQSGSKPAASAPAAPRGVPTGVPTGTAPASPKPREPEGVPTPPDYVIGPDDTLQVVFWREKDMSAEVAVRPDGKISLPLLNDIQASGLTPEQLRLNITEAAAKFVEEPTVTVVVREINSRKVFITGQVAKAGPYPLGGPTTVLQLIATAGGVLEYADSENITIMRTENGKPVSFRFNYKEVVKRKNLKQNIDLKPGDTVIVP